MHGSLYLRYTATPLYSRLVLSNANFNCLYLTNKKPIVSIESILQRLSTNVLTSCIHVNSKCIIINIVMKTFNAAMRENILNIFATFNERRRATKQRWTCFVEHACANCLGIVTEFCYFKNVQRQFVNENIGREHETPRVLIVTR